MTLGSRAAVAGAVACVCATGSIVAQRTSSRIWERGSWRNVGLIAHDAGVLDQPRSIARAPNALYAFDAGPGSIVALDLDGRVRWRYTPPSSLRFNADRVVALAAGPDGGVWAADPNSGRCLVLSPLGTIERVILMHDSPHLAPRSDGTFWKASYMTLAPTLFDAHGHRVRALRLPATVVAPVNAVGDAILALEGDTLVIAYRTAGRFVFAPPHGVARDVRAVEPRAFVRFRESDVTIGGRSVHTFKAGADEPPATLGLASEAGVVYVLYWNEGGTPDDHERTLDMYRLSSGKYIGSRRLPLPSIAIAVSGDEVYALTDGGDLHIWRWIPDASKGRTGLPATPRLFR